LPTTGEDVSELKLFAKVRDELTINEQLGIILRGTRIIMPCSLRERAIRLAHEGHQGLAKTKQLIREKIWFPRIDKEVETLIRGCIPCQANGTANHPAQLKMTELHPKAWHAHGPCRFLWTISIEIIDRECVLDHESCLHFFSCVPL
jgi:hypothetical protein